MGIQPLQLDNVFQAAQAAAADSGPRALPAAPAAPQVPQWLQEAAGAEAARGGAEPAALLPIPVRLPVEPSVMAQLARGESDEVRVLQKWCN